MSVLEGFNSAVQEWWSSVRSTGTISPGSFLPLPYQGTLLTAFHSNILMLYVRETFDGLYNEIVNILAPPMLRLCHINGNSGVGKSAFLWYFIIRAGIENPHAVMIYESGATVWCFRGAQVRVLMREDFPQTEVVADEVNYHLIDQKVDFGRVIGRKAIVAASPDEYNVKGAKKLRTTFTRYLPAWEKEEYDALVGYWRQRAAEAPFESEEGREIVRRLEAAELAFSWFGGVPRFLWDGEADSLSEKDFDREVRKSLTNTKLKNVATILQNSSQARDISWRLFLFKCRPGSFKDFFYTFCSAKVAGIYAEQLCKQTEVKIRTFLEASQPFPEYSALRGFVFEQYVIGRALQSELLVMPLVDNVYCSSCGQKNDRKRKKMVDWIQCDGCQIWYHVQCTGLRKLVGGRYECKGCKGVAKAQGVSQGNLLLRYYDGDLETALLAAGADAVKYLWRPLRKNNAVFDFVLPPRTLGQITISQHHPPSIHALVKALKALSAWRELFDSHNTGQENLLLFLIPLDTFPDFQFQPYRAMASRKVSQRAVKGVMQCKVAVPVDGTPYAGFDLPTEMPAISLDLDADMETLEEVLNCQESSEVTWMETEEVSLAEEERKYRKRGLVDEGDDLEALDFRQLHRKRLQALCKKHGIAANTTNEEMAMSLISVASRCQHPSTDEGLR